MRRIILTLASVLLVASLAGCASGGPPVEPAEPPAISSPTGTPTPTSGRPSRDLLVQPVRLPRSSEPVRLDPAAFTTRITNPYWPMRPGSRWIFRDGGERIEVTVTSRTKTILGIRAVVVHDRVTEDGRLVEDTFDWYAQDRVGNVWYLGEATTEYEAGKPISRAGSWQAGLGGAQPGILLPANPRPGLAYRQEYLRGQAEDRAQVLRVGGTVKVPAGTFRSVLITKDFTPLDPGVVEHKFYAPGVGPILALTVTGGSAREELLSYRPGR